MVAVSDGIREKKNKKKIKKKGFRNNSKSDPISLENHRRKKILVSTAVFIIFFLVIYGLLALIRGKYILAIFDFSSSFFMFVTLILYLKMDIYLISRNIMISIIFLVFIYLFVGEGVEVGSYLWTLAFPIYTIFFLESKWGFNISVLFFLSEFILYFSGISHREFKVQFLIRYTGVYISIVMISYIIERIREENFSKVIKANIQLKNNIKKITKVQTTLSASEEKYRNVVEKGNDGILILQNEKIVYSNPQFCRMIGRNEKELKSVSLNKLIPEKDYFKVLDFLLSGIGDSDRDNILEMTFLDINRKKIDVEIKQTVINYQDSDSYLIFVRDIRERKIYERERIKYSKAETFKAVSDGITHDFNNLLTIVMGNVELAKINKKRPEKLISYLNKIGDASERAENLIKQLLTFSSDATLVMSKEYIQEIIPTIIKSFKKINKIKFKIYIPDDLWPVKCDRERIGIAFSNIITNGIESIDGNGVIRIECMNKTQSDISESNLKYAHYIIIKIIDNGKGIPAKNIERIFDPYFSTKENVTQKGMGLGLTIANRLVLNHNGLLRVESKPGKETVFSIFLPADPENS